MTPKSPTFSIKSIKKKIKKYKKSEGLRVWHESCMKDFLGGDGGVLIKPWLVDLTGHATSHYVHVGISVRGDIKEALGGFDSLDTC
jgi:hypothetical protein